MSQRSKLRNINWNLLYTFVVITEEKSISRAAEKLMRGQPTISMALKNLEDQLGCKLIHRELNRFILTDAGKVVYREAKEICGSIDRLSSLLENLDGEISGPLNLTIASHVTSPLIENSLTLFFQRHPRVSLQTTVMSIYDIVDALMANMIHFGIGPTMVQRPDLEYVHLFKEYCGFYCGRPHQLFGKKNLSLSDLSGQKAVTFKSATFSNVLQSVTDMFRTVGFADPLAGVSNHLEEVVRMIVANVGIGSIPIHIAEPWVQRGLMWRLPPYEPTMPIDVYMVSNPKVTPSRAEVAYIETIKGIISTTPPNDRIYGI